MEHLELDMSFMGFVNYTLIPMFWEVVWFVFWGVIIVVGCELVKDVAKYVKERVIILKKQYKYGKSSTTKH